MNIIIMIILDSLPIYLGPGKKNILVQRRKHNVIMILAPNTCIIILKMHKKYSFSCLVQSHRAPLQVEPENTTCG